MKEMKQTKNKNDKNIDMHPYVVRAVASRYCELTDDDEHCPALYFLMTADEEILGITDDPSEGEDGHCIAASEADLTFLTEFQNNWPEANPYFWELQLYRNYIKASMELYRIRRGDEDECPTEQVRKIDSIRHAH